MPPRIRVLSSRTVYNGKIIRVKLDRVIEPGRVVTSREVVCHPGTVVVLSHLPHGRLLLVRQFRYPAQQSLWELVAGAIEAGESRLDAALRELLEETGYRAKSVKPLFDFYPSPGFLTERMHLVEARGLMQSQAQPEADERIRLGVFSHAQLRKMIQAGKIKDGKSLVGLLWLLSLGRSSGSTHFGTSGPA